MGIKRLTIPLLFFALCFLTVKGCTPSFRTVTLTVKNKLNANNGAANDHFGISVGISGERAIVGARGDDDRGRQAGAAYTFKRTDKGWEAESKLVAGDGRTNDHFGISVGISGERVIVGARGEIERGRQSGAAYIFKHTPIGWMQETKLVARAGRTNNHFGASVSISGERAIVGAPGDSEEGIPSGAAYVFRYNGVRWEPEARLVARDGRARDEFGASVSISGERAIVGAPGDDDRGKQSGSAYVFKYTGTDWVQEVRLVARDGRANDIFGHSVSLDETLAIVGAHGDGHRGKRSGSATIFKRTGRGWAREKKLVALDGGATDSFGISVSISGSRAFVGAHGNGHKGTRSGAAYLFKRSGKGWVQEARLVAGDAAKHDNFGRAIAIDGDRFIAGAHGDDDKGTWSGSAYVY